VADAPRPRAHRAPPIADPAGDALLERTDELAKQWAAALILARPLEAIGDVPLEELAREAPSLCAQVLRALRSNVELERLTGEGQAGAREGTAATPRIGAICGARGVREAAEAVEALRGVLWEALLDELGRSFSERSTAALAVAVCDRLAYVCAAALSAAVDVDLEPTARPLGGDGVHAGVESIARASAAVSPAGGRAVIVDELAGERGLERGSSAQAATPVLVGERPAQAEIAIRDQRGEEGPAAWVGSIGAQLERFARDGLPFAVLLVELADIERLHDEPTDELSRLAGEVEKALAGAVGGGSVVFTRERPGRCWVLAPDTDRTGARELADRLVSAVMSGVSHRGAPLEVAVGTAVCPEDGREPATLAAYADVGLYAARAAIRASATRPGVPVDEAG
jgi:GGDEF domain-containing protein